MKTFDEWLKEEKEAAALHGDDAALLALCSREEADKLKSRRSELAREQYERRHGFSQIENALRVATAKQVDLGADNQSAVIIMHGQKVVATVHQPSNLPKYGI